MSLFFGIPLRAAGGTGDVSHSMTQSVFLVPPPGTQRLVETGPVQKPGVGVLVIVGVGVCVRMVGVSVGVSVIVGVRVLVGVKVAVGMISVKGLETVVPIEPFCTGVAVIDRVLL